MEREKKKWKEGIARCNGRKDGGKVEAERLNKKYNNQEMRKGRKKGLGRIRPLCEGWGKDRS